MQVVNLFERVVHENTEFDHLSGMASLHFGQRSMLVVLVKFCLVWLVEQQFDASILLIDQTAYPTRHVVLKTADEGRHAYGWA